VTIVCTALIYMHLAKWGAVTGLPL